MILLAGLLLVMAYLIFSTQTALLATVGQEAGREATNPLFRDFTGIRSGLGEIFEQELADSGGVVRCPSHLSNWKGRVETLLATITQLESNRGQIFRGVLIGAERANVDGDAALELVTRVSFYLSDGDSSIHDEVRYFTNCT